MEESADSDTDTDVYRMTADLLARYSGRERGVYMLLKVIRYIMLWVPARSWVQLQHAYRWRGGWGSGWAAVKFSHARVLTFLVSTGHYIVHGHVSIPLPPWRQTIKLRYAFTGHEADQPHAHDSRYGCRRPFGTWPTSKLCSSHTETS